ncbi:uncharacterized protein LDX57_004541 [Aspergillus melleus]|uniref:uncharacterized protein n=1 Tax=Aspergillus melleus TaxID=138277 RepID=UPI001E8D0B6C|nr:uncharacterized protein LDX57_004541 [Aspergillus melleus]KAH8426811.1 hypothetical protein LDX57_004541 [Aspergillus melleus]
MRSISKILNTRSNRWTPLPQFPLTQTLNKTFPQGAKKTAKSSEIVSEKLCDDILHRLSPLLLRNRPVDVLDLWPGPGLWSSKINDLLQPRRHILIEPNAVFKPVLQPLVDSRSCYKLLSSNPLDVDWHSLYTKHLPEQGPSNSDRTGTLTKNDTLLVLAHPPPPSSKKDHFTPARWLASFMSSCIRNTEINLYGSVRLIAVLPPADAQTILPRTTHEIKRPALLTECITLHAFEVAAAQDPGSWITYKGWDLVSQSAARVAQRAAEQGIVTPKDREWPPYELAPECPDPGSIPCPYVPRLKTSFHTRMMETINAEQELLAKKPLTKNGKPPKKSVKHGRCITLLNQDNRHAFIREELIQRHAKLEELTRSLSRAAADPQADSTTLRPLVNEIEAVKSAIAQQHADVHWAIIKLAPVAVDDRRAALPTGNFDDASLLWDRRPFEPLAIRPEELYPREHERTMIYFEPDLNPPAMRKLNQLEPAQRDEALRLFEALTFTLSVRPLLSVTEMFQIVLPNRSINSLVQAVPSLATFAAKTLKPDFDSLPKTIHGDTKDAGGKPLDPADCYQENLDYDLSDVRLRSLSTKTMLDICFEYQKSDQQHSAMHLNRLLGGTLTSFRTGDYLTDRV